MGYNSETKTLSTSNGSGISLGDISRCIGNTSLALDKLCTSSQIRKWAKYKPIRYNSKILTTEVQKAGMNSDKQSGYIYGLKLANHNSIWNLFTETNWFDYIAKPSGGTYPYRVLDFNGYCHNAKSTLVVSSTFSTIEVGEEPMVQIDFDDTNENVGIPYGQVVTEGNDDNNATLKQMYLGVAVMNADKTWCYAAALKNGNAWMNHYSQQVLPMYSGGWENIYVFTNLDTIPELENISSDTSLLLSFFVMHSSGVIELDGEFHEIGQYDNMGTTWPILNGVQVPVTLVQNHLDVLCPYGYLVDFSHDDSLDQLSFTPHLSKTPTVKIDMRMEIHFLNPDNLMEQGYWSKNVTISANTTTIPTEIISNLRDIGVNGDVRADWTVYTRINGYIDWTKPKTGSFSFHSSN